VDVVARICELPVEFRTRGNASVTQLVEESGYAGHKTAVTVEAVSRYIHDRPDLIEAWFSYSEDQRTSSGWYLICRADGKFEVGYFPKGERLAIADREAACAEFIVREIRSIAG
jgi:hypothetical protein